MAGASSPSSLLDQCEACSIEPFQINPTAEQQRQCRADLPRHLDVLASISSSGEDRLETLSLLELSLATVLLLDPQGSQSGQWWEDQKEPGMNITLALLFHLRRCHDGLVGCTERRPTEVAHGLMQEISRTLSLLQGLCLTASACKKICSRRPTVQVLLAIFELHSRRALIYPCCCAVSCDAFAKISAHALDTLMCILAGPNTAGPNDDPNDMFASYDGLVKVMDALRTANLSSIAAASSISSKCKEFLVFWLTPDMIQRELCTSRSEHVDEAAEVVRGMSTIMPSSDSISTFDDIRDTSMRTLAASLEQIDQHNLSSCPVDISMTLSNVLYRLASPPHSVPTCSTPPAREANAETPSIEGKRSRSLLNQHPPSRPSAPGPRPRLATVRARPSTPPSTPRTNVSVRLKASAKWEKAQQSFSPRKVVRAVPHSTSVGLSSSGMYDRRSTSGTRDLEAKAKTHRDQATLETPRTSRQKSVLPTATIGSVPASPAVQRAMAARARSTSPKKLVESNAFAGETLKPRGHTLTGPNRAAVREKKCVR